MIGFTAAYNRLLGRGAYAVTVPTLDGAFQPNDLLDQARVVLHRERVDNATARADGLLFSAGRDVFRLSTPSSTPELLATMPSDITALACNSDGACAIGLNAGGVWFLDGQGNATGVAGAKELNCPVALAFAGSGRLLVANGSRHFAPSDWKRDFISKGRSGSIVSLAPGDARPSVLYDGLRFPWGLCVARSGKLVFTEAWGFRICTVDLAGGKRITPVVEDLAGYPGRIAETARGTFQVAFLAVRRQLTEFVMHEDEFRRRMVAEIDPEYWIGPSLHAERSFREPMQQGSLRALNIIKPWAPTQYYGLVGEFDDQFTPISSMHSRADGARHGITSVTEWDGRLYATSRSADAILELPNAGDAR